LSEPTTPETATDDIRQRIKSYLLANSLVPIEPDALTGDLNIIETGLADSVLILDIVGYLDEQFGILLGPNDIVAENFISIDRLVALVARYQKL
jgi:acyl carrier protein